LMIPINSTCDMLTLAHQTVKALISDWKLEDSANLINK
jgi:hypothetical protein